MVRILEEVTSYSKNININQKSEVQLDFQIQPRSQAFRPGHGR